MRAAWLAPLALGLAGCFGADGALRADGSGTVEIRYVPPSLEWVLEREAARWGAPAVRILALAQREGGGTVRLAFDDVTRLASVEALHHVRVTRLRRENRERLQIRLFNTTPRTVKAGVADDPSVALTLPGGVTWANRGAEFRGDRVSWRIPLVRWAEARVWGLTVRYTVPGA